MELWRLVWVLWMYGRVEAGHVLAYYCECWVGCQLCMTHAVLLSRGREGIASVDLGTRITICC